MVCPLASPPSLTGLIASSAGRSLCLAHSRLDSPFPPRARGPHQGLRGEARWNGSGRWMGARCSPAGETDLAWSVTCDREGPTHLPPDAGAVGSMREKEESKLEGKRGETEWSRRCVAQSSPALTSPLPTNSMLLEILHGMTGKMMWDQGKAGRTWLGNADLKPAQPILWSWNRPSTTSTAQSSSKEHGTRAA